MKLALAAVLVVLIAGAVGCGGSPFAVRVVSFHPGPGAGFGEDKMPDVVLGPPHAGAAESQAGLDVVSLGKGGTIVLELGEDAVDGDGPDLLVFENPFKLQTGAVFAEPGAVAVSDDGVAFHAFPCAPAESSPNGCAGYGIVRASPDNDVDATDAKAAGGDAFDLADIGVSRARWVRIVDEGPGGAAPKAGFDLDAVAVASHSN